MASIYFKSEADLVAAIRSSAPYHGFRANHFEAKTQREEAAWSLLGAHRGKYTRKFLERVFDIIDLEGEKARWFGALLADPNRNQIFETPIAKISKWIEYVCFSGDDAGQILDRSLGEMKIKGASKGLVTLLLHLSDPSHYSVWVNKTQDGLAAVGRLTEKRRGWGAKYAAFNESALEFGRAHSFDYRELDWVLFFIGSHVTSESRGFKIDKDVLKSSSTADGEFQVAEESDIEGLKTEVVQMKSKRSRKLRDAAFKVAKGVCAVCGRDFSMVLGGRGIRVLQVHHLKQLAARDAPSVTKQSDLAVVCANCHLLLHLDSKKALSIKKLQAMLRADGSLPSS